ncbi:MAG: amidohydrolase family protein [Pseudomonadota bacterium]
MVTGRSAETPSLRTALSRFVLVGGVAALLAACGDSTSSPSGTEDGGVEGASVSNASVAPGANAIERRTVNVTLTEGTNLAVAANTATKERVLSLQGTLFLVDTQGEVRALIDPYYDAREPQLSADGSRTVFQGYREGNWDIWQVENTPGQGLAEPLALTDDPYDDREPQYAADGSRVVFSSDRGGSYDIWQVEVATGALSALTETEYNSYSPSLSATGVLAYAQQISGTSRIIVQAAQPGEGDTVMVEEVGTISGVQWSPDGQAVGYQLLGSRGTEMKVVNTGTKMTRTISQRGDDVFPFRPQWLDAQKLAYTANGKVVDYDLTSQTAADWPFAVELSLTRHDYPRRQRNYDPDLERPVLGIASPVISNDGGSVYFSALGDLWHWQAGERVLQQLTDDVYADYAPALAPDGERLAFVSDRSGSVGLYLLDLNTGEVTQMPVQAGLISMPSWSPDGTQIGFFVDVPTNPLGGQMVVLDVATGEMESVLLPMPAQPISWSADGARIAVTRLNAFSSRYREGVYELLVKDLQTDRLHAILPEPHQSVSYAGLTPQGAMSYVQGGRLWQMELDDNLQPVESAGTLTSEVTDMPAWSSNGEYLVYLAGNRLKRLTVASGEIQDISPAMTYTLDTPTSTYVVRAGQMFDGVNNTYLLNRDIWIQGERISQIVAAGSQDIPEDVQIIDASDYAVVPGLFEMHAHMGETSEVQGRVWLSYGITTVRDPGSSPYVAKARQEAWDSGRRIGPRTHITGYLTDGNRVYYAMAEGIVSETHLQDALQRTEELELDFVKTYVRLPDHWQRQVVEFAHGLGIPVSSHELYPAVAHGMDHVEHIGGTSRRGYQPKVSRIGYSYQDVVALLSASGMGLTATAVLPGYSVIVAEEPDWFDTPQFEHFYGDAGRAGAQSVLRRFGAGAARYAEANGRLLRALTENDALLVTGTDSPFVPYGAGLHAEFRLYSRAGVSPLDILRQATVKSAQAAGVAQELGTLEAGKLADLVIVDGDPLADIRELDKVVATIKHGHHYPLQDLLQ